MSNFRKFETDLYKLTVPHWHVSLRAVKLVTRTDDFDTLVEERVVVPYRGKCEEVSGQIFILTDKVKALSTVIVIPAPDFAMPTAKIEKSELLIDTCGFPVYVSECPAGEAERRVRDWYREQYKPATIHAMSNTWGDRNGRTRVCDEFIRREIESGADLGLDVVQIDDGWQTGIPEVWDEERNRLFEGDFWELKTDIFPSGMKPLAEYAREHGVELGLWFAPHSRGVFEHFDRDLSVLEKAYRDWSIRYFKLDMISLPTRPHCDKMIELLEKIKSFGEGVSTELDVTADRRLGYLASAPYGTIFVENRYTAWGNYYPYRTLRNIWMLSRFIPTSKLQFELVNPELFTDKYDECDPFRHGSCDADYLFACVMLSNPLFWMETQFLSEKSRAELKSIIPTWKQYREELTHADVRPIGEEPSGASLTGFAAETDDAVHLLLFREATDRNTFDIDLGIDVSNCEVIAEKGDTDIVFYETILSVGFSEPRSFVWLRIAKG